MAAQARGANFSGFASNDVVFGLAEPRERYFEKAGKRIATTVDAYKNFFIGMPFYTYHDGAGSYLYQPYNAEETIDNSKVRQFRDASHEHKKYDPRLHSEAAAKDTDERIKDICKFGLEYFLAQKDIGHIHFILDGVDFEAVFNKPHHYHAKSFTASELRKLFRLWLEQPEAVRAKVILWDKFQRVDVETFMQKYQEVYLPKSATKREARNLLEGGLSFLAKFSEIRACISSFPTIREKMLAFRELIHKRDIPLAEKHAAFAQIFMECGTEKSEEGERHVCETIVMSYLDVSYRNTVLRNSQLRFSAAVVESAKPTVDKNIKGFFGYMVGDSFILAGIKEKLAPLMPEAPSKSSTPM